MRLPRTSVPFRGAVSLLAALCLFSPPACSLARGDRIEIPSSFNPVGSGARAVGMGGAFIAVADDATAASWNPGGLIQLEKPEFSIVGSGFYRTEDNTFGSNPEASGDHAVWEARLNFVSLVFPFTALDHNMVVSLSYQHLFDFNRQWKFKLFDGISDWNIRYRQEGALYAYGASYCVQLLPELSFGFTLNLWEDGLYDNAWEQTIRTRVRDPLGTERSLRKERFAFSGFNANVGLLWSVTDKLNLGAVYKTPFTADLDHTRSASRADPRTVSFDEHLDMPMSYGIGLSYRFSDHLTISGDVYRTHWDDFVLEDEEGKRISPVSGLPTNESDIDPTIQVRMGAEYRIIKSSYVIPLRAGVFYDPAPAEGKPDDFFGFSLGSGVGIGRFMFDVAYQYRFGRDVGGSILRDLDFSQDVDEHSIYTSLVIHF